MNEITCSASRMDGNFHVFVVILCGIISLVGSKLFVIPEGSARAIIFQIPSSLFHDYNNNNNNVDNNTYLRHYIMRNFRGLPAPSTTGGLSRVY